MKLFYVTFLAILASITLTTCNKNSILEQNQNNNHPQNLESSISSYSLLSKDLKWFSDLIEETKGTDPTKALIYASQLIETSQKLDDKNGEGLGYYQSAYVYEEHLRMYVNALTNYFKSLDIYIALNNKQAISSCFLRIGVIYYKVGLYDDALKYYQQFLENAQKIGNKKDEAIAYRSIALTYRELYKDPSIVISSYEESLQIRTSLNDEIGIADCFNGIANTYLLNNK